MTALYTLRGVQHRFGDRLALDLPALELHAGHLYALVGPNGSGKTTLLTLLAFLARPTAGEVRFDGAPVAWHRAPLRALRREVTLVHQTPYLFIGTVAENVTLGLAQRGTPAEVRRAAVREALEEVGLPGFEGRDARGISGGEARRVALARALVLRPRVLLLDEPLANLDRASTAAIEQVIARFPRDGRTVIVSTHDHDHPRRLGSRVLALEEGRLAAPAEAASEEDGDGPAADGRRGEAVGRP